MKNKHNICINLKYLREQCGYTKKQVAKLCGIGYNTYIKYENGSLIPCTRNIIKFSFFYNVTCDFLMEQNFPST